jgi:hypothetical protein
MALITLTFPQPLNASVQVGDAAYYTNDAKGVNLVKMGTITATTANGFTCNIDDFTIRPLATSFILFTKDNKANLTSILGYFANVQFRNDSQDYAELFSVGSEVVVSSK